MTQMRTNLATCAAFAALVLGATSCGGIVDPNHTSHPGCTTWYNSIWQNKADLTLNHSDSRSCPVTLQYGQQGATGGVVYDNAAVYGQPSTVNTINLTVQAFDFVIGSGNDCTWELGFPSTTYFGWILVPPNNQQFRWQAEAYPTYYAGDSPDAACFNVDLWDELTDARAVIHITYNGTQT